MAYAKMFMKEEGSKKKKSSQKKASVNQGMMAGASVSVSKSPDGSVVTKKYDPVAGIGVKSSRTSYDKAGQRRGLQKVVAKF